MLRHSTTRIRRFSTEQTKTQSYMAYLNENARGFQLIAAVGGGSFFLFNFIISSKVDALEGKMEAKMDSLEGKMEAKMDSLEGKMEAKMDSLKITMISIQKSFEDLNWVVRKLETRIETFQGRQTDQGEPKQTSKPPLCLQ